MKSVEKVAEEIVAREGGYVNDPDDPGGPTKHGVTLATLKRLGLDLTGDGRTDIGDVRAMTPERAREIFLRDYYRRPQIDLLPPAVQASVFDMYVNAGARAVVLLQRLLAAFGEPVAADGVIGPKTAGAAIRAFNKAPDHLVDAYGIERRNYYYRLADRRPASRKFARRRDGGKGGWIIRAEEFISARYRFTEEDHHRRIAAWG